MIMKYGIGVLILIVCMFGYMYKHNKDQRAELQKEHEARIQVEKQNQIDAEQREKQRQEDKAKVELDRIQRENEALLKKQNAEKAQIQLSELTIKKRLIDADSAKFQNQSGFCGEVNSKNRMGGYTGFSRYIANTDTGLIVIETDKDPMDPEWWRTNCH